MPALIDTLFALFRAEAVLPLAAVALIAALLLGGLLGGAGGDRGK